MIHLGGIYGLTGALLAGIVVLAPASLAAPQPQRPALSDAEFLKSSCQTPYAKLLPMRRYQGILTLGIEGTGFRPIDGPRPTDAAELPDFPADAQNPDWWVIFEDESHNELSRKAAAAGSAARRGAAFYTVIEGRRSTNKGGYGHRLGYFHCIRIKRIIELKNLFNKNGYQK